MTALVMLLVLSAVVMLVSGHGMLMDPVNRASMWRQGFPTPINYDDNALFCGGAHVQWTVNKGRCGECGDNWALPRPRPNENTGKFGTGIIVKQYRRGDTFTASALVTANHRGWFYFRLCPLSTSTELETKACFDQHPVKTVRGEDLYPLPGLEHGVYNVTLRLPPDVSCEHCVLQWTYKAGNSWGICSNGTGALGCGPQEHFRTCSDISIR